MCVKEYQKKRLDTISFPLPLNQPDSWEASNLNIKKYPTDLLVITYSNNNCSDSSQEKCTDFSEIGPAKEVSAKLITLGFGQGDLLLVGK